MHAQARGRADRVGPRLAQHWWAWRALIGPLSTRYRVICPDIRGLGWSEGPARGYGLHRLAEDLIGLLDALGIERAQLVGHDWGTAVGYQAGLNRPERFSRFLALGGLTLWSSAGAPPRLFLRQWHIPALGLLGHYATTRLGISETRYGAGAMPGGSREEVETYTQPLRRAVSANATQQYYRSPTADTSRRGAAGSRS